MPPGLEQHVLQQIRRHFEYVAFGTLNHVGLAGPDDSQEHILNEVLRLRAVPDTAQEVGEEGRGEARRELVARDCGGGLVGGGGARGGAVTSWRGIYRR